MEGMRVTCACWMCDAWMTCADVTCTHALVDTCGRCGYTLVFQDDKDKKGPAKKDATAPAAKDAAAPAKGKKGKK